MALNERQQAFVTAMVSGTLSRSEAARIAGYSVRSAGTIGNRLMENDEIKAAIDLGLAQNAELSLMDRKSALLRLKHWALTNDGALSVKAIAQISKMVGWDAPTKVDATVTALTPEERKRRMAILIAETAGQ